MHHMGPRVTEGWVVVWILLIVILLVTFLVTLPIPLVVLPACVKVKALVGVFTELLVVAGRVHLTIRVVVGKVTWLVDIRVSRHQLVFYFPLCCFWGLS